MNITLEENRFHAESRYNIENQYAYGLLCDSLQRNAISNEQISTLQCNESRRQFINIQSTVLTNFHN